MMKNVFICEVPGCWERIEIITKFGIDYFEQIKEATEKKGWFWENKKGTFLCPKHKEE